VEVFLVHMGGPFWQHKDEGAWSMPKGEFESEPPLEAAIREFKEETGLVPEGKFLEMSPVRQSSGKTIFPFALEWDCDASKVKSNTFTMEWPKGSGLMRDFPEIDRAAWLSLQEASTKLVKGQVPILDQLRTIVGASIPQEPL
jgi:predicted NUDIX family NTP pyrophosphohydrolase